MAVVKPDAMAVVLAVAFHGVVGEVTLCHFEVWIYDNLQDVVSWLDVRDVDPLAVDVMTIQVPAAHCDALLTKVGTLVPFRDTFVALCVLQAEAGLVPLCHPAAVG